MSTTILAYKRRFKDFENNNQWNAYNNKYPYLTAEQARNSMTWPRPLPLPAERFSRDVMILCRKAEKFGSANMIIHLLKSSAAYLGCVRH